METTYQIDKICRCCLKNGGEMKPLFGYSLDEMLRSFVGAQVNPNDGLPKLVCFQCVLQLSRAFRFKMQCQKSNAIMLEYIKNTLSDQNFIDTVKIPKVEDGIQSESFCEENVNNVSTPEETGSYCNIQDQEEAYLSIEEAMDKVTASAEFVEFKCTTCEKEFNSRKQLVRHIKIHDDNKPHKCFECNKMFSQSCNLKKHSLKHTYTSNSCSLNSCLCPACGKSFKYNSSLSKHMKFHTGKNLLYCPSCPKFFSEKTTLRNHLRCHTGDRPFVCRHCNRSFTSSSNLNKHQRLHSDKRPFKCNICGRTFVERNYLTIHIKTHSKEQKALCSKCGKCLANAKSLHAHMRIHANNRVHACGFENCDKTFARLDTALIHRRIHTGEKPFSCNICSHSFKTSDQLLNHSRTHSGEKPFACNICLSTFSTRKSLKLHSIKHKCSDIVDAVHTENVNSIHHGVNHKEDSMQTYEQSVILFKINENGELVHGTDCSFLSNP